MEIYLVITNAATVIITLILWESITKIRAQLRETAAPHKQAGEP